MRPGPGDLETPGGDLETWRPKTRRPEDSETQRTEDLETRTPGYAETRRPGDSKAQKPGSIVGRLIANHLRLGFVPKQIDCSAVFTF